ncbi:MAG: 16S rRNA (guanine(527)-N(7))-methyltransferase RsmG [Bacteroidales bacterium]|nr:16S rRNA (guanine(527)-N(7))-methyltransferase RsmG [Bacteroidales bacterium]
MTSDIKKYFPTLTPNQEHQFSELDHLYRYWNEKINVISRKDINNLYLHHILHSLAIGLAIRFTSHTHILDAGTGGGLPGIPLAILFPDVRFTLLDSIGKKIHVVAEISRELKLTNIEPVQNRLESMNGMYHFVTGRAVTDIRGFYHVARKIISREQKNKMQNGILYLSGGDIDKQIDTLHPNTKITPLSAFFDEDYFASKKLIYIPAR